MRYAQPARQAAAVTATMGTRASLKGAGYAHRTPVLSRRVLVRRVSPAWLTEIRTRPQWLRWAAFVFRSIAFTMDGPPVSARTIMTVRLCIGAPDSSGCFSLASPPVIRRRSMTSANIGRGCLLAGLLWGSALAGQVVADDMYAAIDEAAAAVEDRVVAWRRDVHEHPELSNREYRTAKLVAAHLTDLGLEVTTGISNTGVVGLLRGGKPGPVVALRADMDALPVVEQTGLPYASKVTATYLGKEVGVMHACGHDNHVAILMGVASVLTGLRDELPGTVKFVFQPAEEGAPPGEESGAEQMVKEGVLENPEVDAIFALHVFQAGATGMASYRSGGAMASAQTYEIEIVGRQTHGARPWEGVDPIVAGAQIVTALQTIVSRQVDVTVSPAVVTVGTFESGMRYNIVPDRAKLTGTIRSYDAETRELIHREVREIATGVGSALGAEVTVNISRGVPVTYNDPSLTAAMVPTLERIYGKGNVIPAPRQTGAEDFAFFQEKVPGFYFFIGVRPVDVPADEAIPNHSPFFYADEAALLPGVRAMANVAYDYLSGNAGY